MTEVLTTQREIAQGDLLKSLSEFERTELDKLKKRSGRFTGIAWICVIVGVIVTVSGIFAMWGSDLNEIGDFVGGTAGALWGLAGLFFIYVAFLGQKEQLIYQQAELRETRKDIRQQAKELEGQKEQLELQNEQTKVQIFENTFFQLLRLHNDILNDIDLTNHYMDGQIDHITGRSCFTSFIDRLKTEYMKSYQDPGSNTPGSRRGPVKNDEKLRKLSINSDRDKQEIREAYQRFYEQSQSDVGHYFRNLYHVVKYVKESDVIDGYEKKKFYTNLVRAQLSSFELLLLFYNCLSKYGYIKFKPLIEEYEFLENMPVSELFQPWHKSYYAESAFGEVNPEVI